MAHACRVPCGRRGLFTLEREITISLFTHAIGMMGPRGGAVGEVGADLGGSGGESEAGDAFVHRRGVCRTGAVYEAMMHSDAP